MDTDARVGAALRRLLVLDHRATRSAAGTVERVLGIYHGQSADGDGESYVMHIGTENGPPVYAGDTLLDVLEGVVAQEAS